MTPNLLIVDDEKPTRDGLRAALEDRYEVYVAEDATSATGLLEAETFDVLLTDFRLPNNEDGMKLIARAKSLAKPPICILMTAYGSEELAVEALKQGADDYLAKGRMQIDELETRIARALKLRTLESENQTLKQQLDKKFGLENIIGESEPMQRVMDVVRQVAPARATVLIQGESGTGKELVARALHTQSPRAQKPFIKINCAALPETLIESEFFGHEKGAFTGAVAKRQGRFELAHGGTILLDEISEISLAMQAKLLRVLQGQEFERVGGSKTIKVDVRVIATTNRDLEESVEKGDFRQDLFFRLNVIPIYVPPLRERVGDIQFLAEKFRELFVRKHGVSVEGFSDASVESLVNHDFPGNVRELQNVVERAVILCGPDGSIEPEQLNLLGQALGQPTRQSAKEAKIDEAAPEKDGFPSMDEVEKEHIIRALGQVDHNRTKAAKLLGMNVRTLRNKINAYREEAESEEDLAKLGDKD